MKNILVIGAGLSSSYLIKYLLDHAEKEQWQLTVADANPALAEQKLKGNPYGKAVTLNIQDTEELKKIVSSHDIVVSLLPASMHVTVARQCIAYKKHLVTASYVSPEMKQLDAEARAAGVLLLNEIGLDPGIDHLSAMKMIHTIQQEGGTITQFRSYCGGLVAPAYDDNPWHYKFTWNPRNVVLAGQATARYLDNGELKFIPASRIFSQTENVHVPGYGKFECYANRDSLEYITPYGIESAKTVLRGTMRREGFCEAWNMIVQLGLNDDSFVLHHSNQLTHRDFLHAFVPGDNHKSLEKRVAEFLKVDQKSEAFQKLQWLGLFDKTPVTLNEATPAQILQDLLQHKWKLNKGELDMIVMKHILHYETGKNNWLVNSSLVVKGENEVMTAMAKTVGLPMAIATRLILSGKVESRGVQIPIMPEIYEPVMKELVIYDVQFKEEYIRI